MLCVIGIDGSLSPELSKHRDIAWALQNLERCRVVHRAWYSQRVAVKTTVIFDQPVSKILVTSGAGGFGIWNIVAIDNAGPGGRINTSSVRFQIVVGPTHALPESSEVRFVVTCSGNI